MRPISPITSARLSLDPLAVSDAHAMVEVLGDEAIYTFTGGEPPDEEKLKQRYESQVRGSGRDNEQWLNWIIRPVSTSQPVGFVQATVMPDEAEIAWTVAVSEQGNGYATEAAAALRLWLEDHGVQRVTAHIHTEHVASQRVAAGIGLVSSGELDDDGEVIWTT